MLRLSESARPFLDGWTEHRGSVTSAGGDNIFAAIGASHPDQVRDNVKTPGVRLEPDLLKAARICQV
jgi:hypothetical protein